MSVSLLADQTEELLKEAGDIVDRMSKYPPHDQAEKNNSIIGMALVMATLRLSNKVEEHT